MLFQVDAPGSGQAQFTPDSENLVFYDKRLRVESWSISKGTRNWAKELVVYESCMQKRLSSDGKTLICSTMELKSPGIRVGIRLVDVGTGTVYFENPKFYEPGALEWGWMMQYMRGVQRDRNLIAITISPDSHYLIAVAGTSRMAFDLVEHKPIQMSGKLKDLIQTNIAFVGNDAVYVPGDVVTSNHLLAAKLVSFPEGKVLSEHEIGGMRLFSSSNPRYLIVSPLKEYNVGVVEVATSTIVTAAKLQDMDISNEYVALEDSLGNLLLNSAKDFKPVKRIVIRQGPLPGIRAVAISPDGKYLAASLRYRAGIWDLSTGRERNVTRPFTSGWIDANDEMYGQFPKYLSWDATEMKIPLSTGHPENLAKLDDDEWQYHEYELRLKPNKKGADTSGNVTLEVKKMKEQTVAWTRSFEHERPAVWPGEGNRLVLGWDLASKSAKDEIKTHTELQAVANGLADRKKGLLIDVVNAVTGASEGVKILPEADLTHGWDDERRTRVSGDYALVSGEHNNVVIYKLSDGTKVGEFFGELLAADAELGLVVAANREDEILFVEEKTGKEIRRFTLGSPVRYATIVSGGQNMFYAVTADQMMHRIPLVARH